MSTRNTDIDKEGEQRSRQVEGLVMWKASSCGRPRHVEGEVRF